MSENHLNLENHLLVCVEVDVHERDLSAYLYLKSNFCGRVLCAREKDLGTLTFTPQTPHGIVYVCGNIQLLYAKRKNEIRRVKIIQDFSFNVEGRSDLEYVSLGQVPINLHDVAVYYRSCLKPESNHLNYFDTLQIKHKFQTLTESTKPGISFRKGVYLSEVETEEDASKFHLLRCSTNLDGPTLAFVDEDREILTKVNELGRRNFEQTTEFNHVLAQVYENSVTIRDGNKAKEHKAKIKSHSDKTKDMPARGLIAFCTFYSSDIADYKESPHDRFNHCYKGASVLTQLRFILKKEVHDSRLTKDFRVPLYPNSILLIPLSTNRLYTHEICPPTLPVGKFPTRLGYVVRCSKTKAVFKNNSTFIQRDGQEEFKLEKGTPAEFGELKKLYQEENLTANKIKYGDVYFSLNEGDYKRPLVE